MIIIYVTLGIILAYLLINNAEKIANGFVKLIGAISVIILLNLIFEHFNTVLKAIFFTLSTALISFVVWKVLKKIYIKLNQIKFFNEKFLMIGSFLNFITWKRLKVFLLIAWVVFLVSNLYDINKKVQKNNELKQTQENTKKADDAKKRKECLDQHKNDNLKDSNGKVQVDWADLICNSD